jgi:hypothetical protein
MGSWNTTVVNPMLRVCYIGCAPYSPTGGLMGHSVSQMMRVNVMSAHKALFILTLFISHALFFVFFLQGFVEYFNKMAMCILWMQSMGVKTSIIFSKKVFATKLK